jgi:hypothetical protein
LLKAISLVKAFNGTLGRYPVGEVGGEQLVAFRACACMRPVEAVERPHVNRPALVPDYDASALPVPAHVPYAAAAIPLRPGAILVALLLCGGAEMRRVATRMVVARVADI